MVTERSINSFVYLDYKLGKQRWVFSISQCRSAEM